MAVKDYPKLEAQFKKFQAEYTSFLSGEYKAYLKKLPPEEMERVLRGNNEAAPLYAQALSAFDHASYAQKALEGAQKDLVKKVDAAADIFTKLEAAVDKMRRAVRATDRRPNKESPMSKKSARKVVLAQSSREILDGEARLKLLQSEMKKLDVQSMAPSYAAEARQLLNTLGSLDRQISDGLDKLDEVLNGLANEIKIALRKQKTMSDRGASKSGSALARGFALASRSTQT